MRQRPHGGASAPSLITLATETLVELGHHGLVDHQARHEGLVPARGRHLQPREDHGLRHS
eukprot:6062446-Pyramimonas_sp.AAC.1